MELTNVRNQILHFNNNKITIDAFQDNFSPKVLENNKSFNLVSSNSPIQRQSHLILNNDRYNNNSSHQHKLYPKIKPSSIRKYNMMSARPLSNRVISNSLVEKKQTRFLDVNSLLHIVHPQKKSFNKIIKLSFNRSIIKTKANNNSLRIINTNIEDKKIQVNLSPLKCAKENDNSISNINVNRNEIKEHNRSNWKNRNSFLNIMDCNDYYNYAIQKRIKSSIRFTNKSTCSSFKFSPKLLFD